MPGDLSRGHHALVALDDVDLLATLDQHQSERRGHPIVDSGPTGAVGVHRVGSAEGDRGDGSVEAFPLVSGQSTIAVEPDLAGGGDLAGLRQNRRDHAGCGWCIPNRPARRFGYFPR